MTFCCATFSLYSWKTINIDIFAYKYLLVNVLDILTTFNILIASQCLVTLKLPNIKHRRCRCLECALHCNQNVAPAALLGLLSQSCFIYEFENRVAFTSSVRFLRRPVGPRPATLLSGLQLQKCVGPVGRQLLYLPCGAEWCTTVNGHWRNKILFKRYTFSYDPNQH